MESPAQFISSFHAMRVPEPPPAAAQSMQQTFVDGSCLQTAVPGLEQHIHIQPGTASTLSPMGGSYAACYRQCPLFQNIWVRGVRNTQWLVPVTEKKIFWNGRRSRVPDFKSVLKVLLSAITLSILVFFQTKFMRVPAESVRSLGLGLLSRYHSFLVLAWPFLLFLSPQLWDE